jgi:hypothetical protein
VYGILTVLRFRLQRYFVGRADSTIQVSSTRYVLTWADSRDGEAQWYSGPAFLDAKLLREPPTTFSFGSTTIRIWRFRLEMPALRPDNL